MEVKIFRMFVDTPARITVLGAGPIGLEAALYARSLGYDTTIFERGRTFENVLKWGHVRMFSPFSMNRSTLGLAALAAQDESYQPPNENELLTGNQWAEQYLFPLSRTDLVRGKVCENTRVISVGRDDFRKTHSPGDGCRADSKFRILVEDADGERVESADVVIDTTGSFGNSRWIGRGGIPAIGEVSCRAAIEFGLPDFAADEGKEKYAVRSTLVIGDGYSAATNVVALASLAKASVTWCTRASESSEPIKRIEQDRLPSRDELAQQANRLIADGVVNHLPGLAIEQITFDDDADQFEIRFDNDDVKTFDRVIANVGFRPDTSIYDELQIHQCYASEGPMKLAAALLGQASADCLDQSGHGAETLKNPEPNFYILGAKSYGRGSQFLVSSGLEQIRDAFSIIGGRDDLDLYASMEHLI